MRQKSCLVQGNLKQTFPRGPIELPNKTTEQLEKVATPCIDDHQFKEDGICWRIVKSLLTDCSEMHVFG